MLLAIDPGADTGWAVYDSARRLHACGLSPLVAPPTPSPGMRVVIECEELRGRREKNPNSILLMARNAGEWGGRLGVGGTCVEYIRVDTWKGSTSKKIDHARTWARLDDFEKAIVDAYFKGAKGRNGLAPSRRHNVLDALGIGLWAVGRGYR